MAGVDPGSLMMLASIAKAGYGFGQSLVQADPTTGTALGDPAAMSAQRHSALGQVVQAAGPPQGMQPQVGAAPTTAPIDINHILMMLQSMGAPRGR